jgi:hypothetical protein
MDKQDLLGELTSARAELLDAIDGLAPDQMVIPGAVGIWSVKDVLAHLVAWESELVTALNNVSKHHPPHIVLIEDIDEWNEEQYHANAPRPLEAVQVDLESVHKMVLRMVEGLDKKTLFDNRSFPWMEGEPLVYLIEENAYLHEREHAQEIRDWRSREGL